MGIRDLIPYIGTASVACGVVAFFAGWILNPIGDLEAHLGRALAAAAFPSGLVLVYGATYPKVLGEVPGLEAPILAGGLSVLYLSIRATLRKPPI